MFNWIFSKPKKKQPHVSVDTTIREYDEFAFLMDKRRNEMEKEGYVFYGRDQRASTH